MRMVIDLDEKYKNLYYEMAKATQAVIVAEEPDLSTKVQQHILNGIRKGQEQVKNGQTKSYDEVKQMLAKRWP